MKAAAEFESVPLPPDGVPRPICSSCASGAMFHRPTETAIVYCPHAYAGAVMPMDELRWYVTEGIARSAFEEKVVHELEVKRVLMERKSRSS